MGGKKDYNGGFEFQALSLEKGGGRKRRQGERQKRGRRSSARGSKQVRKKGDDPSQPEQITNHFSSGRKGKPFPIASEKGNTGMLPTLLDSRARKR